MCKLNTVLNEVILAGIGLVSIVCIVVMGKTVRHCVDVLGVDGDE